MPDEEVLIPTFSVQAEGKFKTPKTWPYQYGCFLTFKCPKCGRKNYHGGIWGQPGTCDGYRHSHCMCWPNGYYIKEGHEHKFGDSTDQEL